MFRARWCTLCIILHRFHVNNNNNTTTKHWHSTCVLRFLQGKNINQIRLLAYFNDFRFFFFDFVFFTSYDYNFMVCKVSLKYIIVNHNKNLM